MRWLRLCRIAHLTEKSRSRACARIDSRKAPGLRLASLDFHGKESP
jgi:hypothetical protein